MALPRVAVVGSCVSRDPFNREFAPAYKSRAELVASVFQSAVPSLVRRSVVRAPIPDEVPDRYRRILAAEFSGQNMEALLSPKPDVVVFDNYADIHFGVTTLDSQHVTRNHMAFTSPDAADRYFQDSGKAFPERARFESEDEPAQGYYQLAQQSLEYLLEQLRARNPRARLILNPARFATTYVTRGQDEAAFANSSRLDQKNGHWQRMDDLFETTSGCERLSYPASVFVGDEEHSWGLNPVHYTQSFYDHFWREMARVAGV